MSALLAPLSRRTWLALSAGGAAVLAVAFIARPFANAAGPVNTLDSPSGAAIKGYDPVAYFTAGRPLPGRPEFSLEHGGARWLFSSADNQRLFEIEPARYTPAYGGYCAYGVAQGYLVKIEPDAWTIRDGRLYLNYDRTVQRQWEADPAAFITSADTNWRRLQQKP